jgi:hypothetical protein
MKRLIGYLLILISLTATSCNKDSLMQDVNPNGVVFSSAVGLHHFNSVNPFDSIGVLHNYLLDVLASQPGFDSIDINQFLYDFAFTDLGVGDLSTTMSLNEANALTSDIWFYCLRNEYDSLFHNSHMFSSELKEVILDLLSLLENESDSLIFEDFIDSIKAKENAFLSSSWSGSDSLIYLGMTSVMRHSSYYWQKVMFEEFGNSPYYEHIMEVVSNNEGNNSISRWNWKKFWRGLAVVGADVAGYGLTAAICLSNPTTVPLANGAGTIVGAGCSAAVRDAFNP